MSEESPPTYTTPIFNQAYFNTSAEDIDTAYLNSNYLRYPIAQTGLETIANLATTNDATINGLTVGTGSGSGIENTAIGESALASATTAAQNTAVGHEALYATTNNGTQTAVGFHALRNATGSNNLAIGYRALKGSVGTNIGAYNCAIGEDALKDLTTGFYNTAIGYRALYVNTIGVSNIAIGYKSLGSNLNGDFNIAIGNNALTNLTNQQNSIAIGYAALLANTGSDNIGIGSGALSGTVGSSTGGYNTAVGSGSLDLLTTGTNNVALGYQAGYAGTPITTGSNNTFIGYQAQANANNYSNSTALGAGAIITASNQVVLGTTTERVIIPNQINFSYTSNPTLAVGSIGYTYSSTISSITISNNSQGLLSTISSVPIGVYLVQYLTTYYDVVGTATNTRIKTFAGITSFGKEIANNNVVYFTSNDYISATLSVVYTNTAVSNFQLNGALNGSSTSIKSYISEGGYFRATRIA